MSFLSRRLAVAGLAVALLALVPGSAGATGETLKRSVSNITMAPLDVLASPVVAGITLVRNLQEQDDSLGVKLAYPVPGFLWLTMVQMGGGIIRGLAGVFELLPGIGLLPFQTDLDPLFGPSSENEALVDFDLYVYFLRFGVDYTTPAY